VSQLETVPPNPATQPHGRRLESAKVARLERRDASTPRPVAADQRLIGFLVKAGRLERGEAEAAKKACHEQNVCAIDYLSRELLSEADIAQAVAHGLGLPFVRFGPSRVDEWAVDLVDEPTASRFAVLAVAADDETLTLAMANPFDQEAIKYIEFASGRRVRRTVAPRSEILHAIAQAYGHESTLAAVLADVPDGSGLEVIPGTPSSAAHDVDPGRLAQEAEQAPIIKMVNLILVDALSCKASDIHIEPGPNVVLVRYRIDGMLVDGHQLPKWVQNPLTARIKIMAKADITERRTPQDGHFTIRQGDRLVDVRASVLPTTDGEKFVLRLLDPEGGAPRQLDRLGFARKDLETIRQLIRKPEGMILVTGPTGSGKSSTLCAMIQEIYSPQLNIVTIENPVEFNIPGVSQVDINDKQGLDFATVLRSVLRQDPDVIMVGEIRDRETAEIAFRAAQTGHLVLSTLHTNDTASTITRLLDIGIEPYLIAPSLVAVIAQRLVRKVCERCAQPATAEPRLRRDRPLREGRGCAACHGTGFSGRTGCYEVLEVSKGIQRLIESKASETQIRRLAEEEGMTSLRGNALAKVEAGSTTSDEAMRVVQLEERGPQCPQCLNAVEDHFVACPYCSHALRSACGACGMTLKKDWTGCPYCGAAGAEPAPASAPAAPTEASVQAAGLVERPRILVVDDYADVRLLVRAALEAGDDGFVVQQAENGAEALEMVERERPHLVILDLMMPGTDGYEVCRQLRSNLKTAFIPILMLTALADGKSKSLGFLAGTDDYLVKPFENTELRTRVRWLLERAYRIGVGEGHGGEPRARAAEGSRS